MMWSRSSTRTRRGALLGTVLLAGSLVVGASPASAAEGSIDHVETGGQGLKVLYSLPAAGDAAPDLESVKVTLDGKVLQATASPASSAGSGETVRRTAMLTIDVSESMAQDNRIGEAKIAAEAFLDAVPEDVYVGIVTFAKSVTVAQQPSLDRDASKEIIDGLALERSTHLYDGVKGAVAASGTEGSRSLLLLSDGRDTSKTPLTEVTKAVQDAGVKVDVVGLNQAPEDAALLGQIAEAGNGTVINADDPAALSQVFAAEADTLAQQILVSVTTPAELAGNEGTLSLSIDAGDQTYTDSAFVTLGTKAPVGVGPDTDLAAPTESGFQVSRQYMVAGLVALGLGLLVVLFGLTGGLGKKPDSVESRIDAYTQKGRKGAAAAQAAPQGMQAQAVGIAEKALKANSGIESGLGDRLEAAGLSLKPAEWLLLHAGIAIGAAGVGFMFSGGGLLLAFAGLFAGALLPWLYLGLKRSRRLKAFNSQLAETLQLMAGSLQAGLSLSQGIDTVVREGADPIAGEFRRALVETRLGVQIEDALESIAGRMESADFKWTVMAIRIQREVGGNLSELLLNVAATLRERDYLRRQVKALSAEGRFSAYILLGLPPAVLLYMSTTNPTYLHPLISTPIGYVMLGIMVVLMVVGGLTMKKMIKLEV